MRWPTERSEVRDLTSWCQDNNLHLNVSKTKGADRGLQEEAERGTRPPLHQRDYGGESQQLQVPLGFTSAEETEHGLQDPLQLLQVTHREYPDWLHHRLVQHSCTALNRKALQREVKAAQHITRMELPSMEDLYTQRCRRKATKIKIIKTPVTQP
ncbi:hypothetical protein L3Q82_020888 [Scortum barcoo]|uniref:Uncharacterized protein n=1 Tax=Scortum barcoo TaxID=214431 RepID=A0ACB8V9E0_9TELE|nr:hypothetical protein L3Q82_020888 [Scortum barcoo]